MCFVQVKNHNKKIFTRENLKSSVVVIREQQHLEKICEDLGLDIKRIKLSSFPMIIYEALNNSIDISEISEESLEKLKREVLHSRKVFEFEFVKDGFMDKTKGKE